MLGFYAVLNVIAWAVVRDSGQYIGDAVGMATTSGQGECAAVLGAILLSYVLAYRTIPGQKTVEGCPRSGAVGSVHAIVFVLAAGVGLAAIGFAAMGYGVAESQSAAQLGFVFKLLPYDVAYLLMLCVAPMRTSFVVLGLAYAALRALMGWSGFVALTFFILFMRWLSRRPRGVVMRLCLLFALGACFLVAPHLYALKFLVRYGEVPDYPYEEFLGMLLGRMTPFGNALYAYANADKLLSVVGQYSGVAVAYLDPLLAVLPRAALGIHVENFETAMVYAVHGNMNAGIVFYVTAIGKLRTLWAVHPAAAILWAAEAGVLLHVAARLVLRLCGDRGRPFAVVIGLGFVLSGSLEELGLTLYGLFFLNVLAAVFAGVRPRFTPAARASATARIGCPQ